MLKQRFLLAVMGLGLAMTACVTQPAVPFTSIQVSPATLTVDVGGTQALTAVAKDSSGNAVSGVTFSWASSDPAKATVSNGVVSGVAEGAVNITASANGVTSNAAQLSVSARVPTVIPETTKPVEDNTQAILSSVSAGGTLRFEQSNAQLQGLKPGDVLVSDPTTAAPDGFLRKVSSVRQEGNEVVVDTTEALLTEAVSSGEAEAVTSLTTANLRRAQALRAGVSVQSRALLRPQAEILNLEFNKVLFDFDDKPETTNDQIEVSGSLKLDATMDTALKIRGCWEVPPVCVDRFRAAVKIKETATLKLRGDFEREEKKEYPIAEYEFDPIVLQLGPVPVVLNPKLVAIITLQGKATAKLRWQVTQTANARVGVEYRDDKWKGIHEFENSFQTAPPEISASLKMRADADANFHVKLYGSDSNKVWARANLFGDLDVLSTRSPTYILKGGASAYVGAQAKVLGVKIAKYEAKLFDVEKIIAQGDIPNIAPDAPTISSVDPNPLTLSGYNGGETIQSAFNFSNRGRGALTYTVENVPAWLEIVEGASGSLAQDAQQSVKVRAKCEGSSAAQLVRVKSNDAANPVREILVKLECKDPSIKLAFNPVKIKSLRRGSSDDTKVTIERFGVNGPVTVQLVNPATGFSATPVTIPADSLETILKVNADGNVPLGQTGLIVKASSGSVAAQLELKVNVTVAATKGWLLVDDDQSPNNWDAARRDHRSPSDTTYRTLLTAMNVPHEVLVVTNTYGRPVNGPTLEQMQEYKGVLWYTGFEYDFGAPNLWTVSTADEANLSAFLDLGNRKVLIFSETYPRGLDGTTFGKTDNAFVKEYLGLIGARGGANAAKSFVASGTMETITAGMAFQVPANNPMRSDASVLNPDGGTDALINIPATIGSSAEAQLAAATGRKRTGAAGSSTAILVTFPFENITDIGGNTKRALMEKFLAY
jgi:Bacterial Ig-like domain (group 2)